ncbi:PilZ domain-containing protein [Rhodopirellula sp. JC639]|uniref:PilZ domain-containing protein n=1 Tax=Stieleria mannarensis TaxID=2755585 RepID=UPI0015FF838F|nr:PilZ domain-containing protein [Rhodopirellula sp. JC639]
MLRLTGTAPNLDVENVVRDLLEEDAFYDRIENRSAHREHLVRPVTMQIRGSDETILSFSRGVSAAGISLIADVEIPERSTAVLTIESLKGGPVKVLAQCRWCRPFGANWKISGWQFINIHR